MLTKFVAHSRQLHILLFEHSIQSFDLIGKHGHPVFILRNPLAKLGHLDQSPLQLLVLLDRLLLSILALFQLAYSTAALGIPLLKLVVDSCKFIRSSNKPNLVLLES